MKNELTLIIPTYNRSRLLARLLGYYQKFNFSQMVVVADSSYAPACDTNLNTVASFDNNLKIAYKNFSPEINLLAKLVQVLEGIDSEYAVICSDDDFIVPVAIEKCVAFLKANPDYSIAHGRAARLEYNSADLHKKHTDIQISTYPQCDINDPDAGVRLKTHLEDYTATFYSVHRRVDLMRNMRLSYDNCSDFRFGELLPSCLSLAQGKVKRLDILYMVRQIVHDSTKASIERPSWPSLITAANFSESYLRFHGCLSEELMTAGGISAIEAKAIVDHAFLSFMARMLYISKIGRFKWNHKDVFKQSAQYILDWLKLLPAAGRFVFLERHFADVVRSPRQVFCNLRRERELPLMNPDAGFYSDFMHIYDYVMRFPDGK